MHPAHPQRALAELVHLVPNEVRVQDGRRRHLAQPGLRGVLERAELQLAVSAGVVGVELCTAEGPAAVVHPGACLEVERLERPAVPVPAVRGAAEEAPPRGLELGVRVAHDLAPVEVLGGVLQLETARFDHADVDRCVAQRSRERDARGAGSDDAEVCSDLAPVAQLAGVLEQWGPLLPWGDSIASRRRARSGAAARHPRSPGRTSGYHGGMARGAGSWGAHPTSGGGVGIAMLALAFLGFLAQVWQVQPHLDDAYISYRYARNLAAGLGLVYNAGEYVEGFTNLSWTLLVAGLLALGVPVKLAGHALGVMSGVATLAAAAAFVRAGAPRGRSLVDAGAVCLLLAFATTLSRWSTSGMETALFTALVTAALAAQAHGRLGGATVCAALATATRPEGGLVAAFVLAPAALDVVRGPTEERRRALVCGVGYVAAFAALTLFRLSYYGSPLPNTFYAKAGSGSPETGAHYLLGFLRSGPGLLLVPALLAAWWEPRWRPGAGLIAAYFLYAVLVGGDVFGYRFVLPVLPALIVLAVSGVRAAWQRRREAGLVLAMLLPALQVVHLVQAQPLSLWLGVGLGAVTAVLASRARRAAVVVAASAVALLVVWPAADGRSQLGDLVSRLSEPARLATVQEERERGRRFERLGQRAAEVIAARREAQVRLVATGAIGSFGWHTDLAVLDIFGLTDATIARARSAEQPHGLPGHSRSDASYVLERAPDYVLIGRGKARGWLPAVRDLAEHPEFAQRYAWDAQLRGYRRRDLGPPPSGD